MTALLLAVVSVAQVKVKYSWDVKQRAPLIAAEIAPRLATLQSDFDRERLSRPAAELLDRTEAALLEALNAPELAAMRDAVKEEFRRARAELHATRSGSFPGGSRLTVLPATFRQSSSGSKEGSVLDRIAQFLAMLTGKAEKSEISRDVCVISQPKSGARVFLYPPSYPPAMQEKHTADKVSLFLGLYAYKAQLKGRSWIRCEPGRKGLPSGNCAFLDLLSNEQAIVSCDFELESCVLASGTVEEKCP